jgi:hypothetical protein
MMLKLLRCALACLLLTAATAQDCTAEGVCDKHQRCGVWRDEGECYKNEEYMMKECPASCSDENYPTRNDKICKDYHVRCPIWADLGECDENPTNMKRYCPLACGVCTESDEVDEEDPNCFDREEKCRFWASKGECSANPGYMHTSCAKSCGTCAIVEKKNEKKKNLAAGVPTLSKEDLAIVALSADFGEKQTATGSEAFQSLDIIRNSLEYLKTDAVHLPNHILKKWYVDCATVIFVHPSIPNPCTFSKP